MSGVQQQSNRPIHLTTTMEEENQNGTVINHFEKDSNCQVFNAPVTGCVFAMPGSTVIQQTGHLNDSQNDEQEAPFNPPKKTEDPAKAFADTVKLIMKNAEKDNGIKKPIKARGNGGIYTYNVDGKTFGTVMDKILKSHKDSIEDYLEGSNAKKAVAMKYVCPFLGAVLNAHLFTPVQMEKNDLEDALNSVYGPGSSASTKLSAERLSESGKFLVELVKVELKNLQSNQKLVVD